MEHYCDDGIYGKGIDIFVRPEVELDEEGRETFYWAITKRPCYFSPGDTPKNWSQLVTEAVDEPLIKKMVEA